VELNLQNSRFDPCVAENIEDDGALAVAVARVKIFVYDRRN
jgi:hypothetical protein